MFWCLPSSSSLVLGLSQLNLHAVDTVDAVHEQDEDKDEGDLQFFSESPFQIVLSLPTFKPYCSLATKGFSDMKRKRFLLIVKGNGMMRDMKTAISKTRSANTCDRLGQHEFRAVWCMISTGA